jgi:hypothetical protein
MICSGEEEQRHVTGRVEGAAMNGGSSWFRSLTSAQVAEIVRERGPRTMVFAAGGTIRWFILNHLDGWPEDTSFLRSYMQQGGRRLLEILRLFFEHGVRAVFTHAIAPGQLVGKGEGYTPLLLSRGLARMTGAPEFLRFYQDHGIRVRFFGDHRLLLKGSQYKEALADLDELERRTAHNERHVLFWGLNPEERQAAQVLELATRYYQEHGRVPSREQAIEAYYGEPVEPADILVGFNRPKDLGLIPPLLGGRTDMYFLVGLSLDFSQAQLRDILYDHLYARPGQHRDYGELAPDAFSEMQAFYRLNQGRILGVGRRYEPGSIWHARPQVRLPAGWDEEET